MRKIGWTFAVLGILCVPSIVQTADDTASRERATLDKAIMMASLQFASRSVVLLPHLPSTVSSIAEAWTEYDANGKGLRIFVYTSSHTFRCASARRADYQCLLKLASVLIHEAWHMKNGPDEAGAYNAQLAFVEFNQASPLLINEIRQSRDGVLARQRKAIKTIGMRTTSTDSNGVAHTPRELRSAPSSCAGTTRPGRSAIRASQLRATTRGCLRLPAPTGRRSSATR